MICAIGLGSVEVWTLTGVYFVILALTFYYVVNEKIAWPLKLAKGALALFVPVLGPALIWIEVVLRVYVFKKKTSLNS
ncbi:hypothetical protein [Dyadobacter arcticus]|uniref:Uncharacterized protein n=1 Tax=Dyadobacter arcticus TaxID=1078754 RepID=A0ABX0URR1_9BACT|nr:hypothetical protein [Dyadobacter arcticus]NIJ55669.1 hypothetical protein [Dyadobacter arcticus]